MESTRQNKLRLLTISLIFSGALNVGLLLTLLFISIENLSIPFKLNSGQETIVSTNQQLISKMLQLSFSELAAYLTNCESVGEGFTKRDLALSALVAAHHFNIEKALFSPPPQKQVMFFNSKEKITLYPGLNNEHYHAIIRYAYQEKWPLTSLGLWKALQKNLHGQRESDLCAAFIATPEFYALQILFQKTGWPQEPLLLLDLICQGSWEILENFYQEQSVFFNLSIEKRREILLKYIANRSSIAATLLLQTDFLFVTSTLLDSELIEIVNLFKEPSDLIKRFCLDLLYSSRSDALRRVSAEKLYELVSEKSAIPFELDVAIERFSREKIQSDTVSVDRPSIASSQDSQNVIISELHSDRGKEENRGKESAIRLLPPPLRDHVVQEGENLWKISRQYRVKIEDLVQANGLEKDRLFPGMILRIPQGTGSEPPR